MKTSARLAAINLLLGAALGCDAPALPGGPPTAAKTEATPAEAKAEEKPMVAGAPGEPLPDDAPPVSDVPRPFDIRDPVHGRRSRRAGGYMGAVANSRFAAEYKMTMINVTEALNLYWAPTGEYPKTHEEFMEKVIKENKIVLPELSEDREYIYVAEEPEPSKKLQVRAKHSPSKVEGAPAPAGQPAPADQPPAAGDAAQEEPSPDIRTRAEGIGKESEAEKHAVAPGGLAPAGGIE